MSKSAQALKAAVVGYGGAFCMGKIHLDQMAAAGMVPTAVCEIDESRLAAAETDFPGIETYTSLATLLRKSDANVVTIITPHNTHAKLALQCLRAGRHVVCEKPLAITTAECDRMIAEAKKQKVVLSTYHNRHWDGPILRAVEQIVKKGAIGDVVRIEAHMGTCGQPRDWWRSSKSISGGILYDWGVHLLEYSLQLIDAKMTEVSGFATTGVWTTKWGADTNEDEARAVVRFDTGQYVQLTITQLDANTKSGDRGMLEITGTKGTYMFDMAGWTHFQVARNGTRTVRSGANPPSQWEKYYQNVADAIRGKTRLVITPEWSRRPIHILDLAGQSAKKGKALSTRYA
jgi:predicted dehydrogenase